MISILSHNILIQEDISFPPGTTTSLKKPEACVWVYSVLAMCGILRAEHARGHTLLRGHGLGNAGDHLSWCQHWIQSPPWSIARALLTQVGFGPHYRPPGIYTKFKIKKKTGERKSCVPNKPMAATKAVCAAKPRTLLAMLNAACLNPYL